MTDDEDKTKRQLSPEECELFFELVSKNEKRIHNDLVRYIKSYMPNNHQEVDVVFKDTLSTGLENIHQLADDDSFLRWMVRIAGSKLKRAWNNKARENKALEAIGRDESRHFVPSPDDILIAQEEIQLAYEILDSLPDELKEYYIFRVFFEMEYNEIAEEFQVGIATAYRRVKEAKDLLWERGEKYRSIIPPVAPFSEDHYLDIGQQVYEQAIETGVGTSAVASSPGIQTAAMAGSSTINGILFTLTLPFLWIFSALIGGQYFGTTLIRNAKSLQARRWLTRQVFFAYCGIIAVPLYFYYIGRIGSLYLMKLSNWSTFNSFLYFVLFLCAAAFLLWTRRSYYRFQNPSGFFVGQEISYRYLRCLIYFGFAVLTIAIGVFMLSWYRVIFIPGMEFCEAHGAARLKNTLIFTAAVYGGFMACFHISTFFLFRYFLKISGNGIRLRNIPLPFDAREISLRANKVLQVLLAGFGLLFGLASNIAHLVLVQKRIVFPGLEIAATCLLWYYMLKQNQDNPKKRLSSMLAALVIQISIMFLLRKCLYD